jgi:hypothetical protein
MQGYKKAGKARMSSETSAIEEAKVHILKKAFCRVVEKREKRVITNLVNDYRDGLLTADKAFAAIMAIAELRYAGTDIEQKDLQ